MGKRISSKEAKDLFDNWRSRSGPGGAVERAGFKDSYETWFSIKELKEYLQYLEDNISAEQNPGLRIYFGSYGDIPGPKNKLNTVFLAPTKEEDLEGIVENSNDYTLDAYNSGGTKWPSDPYNI